uniref:Uncharacterized protein n=1 Tax=Seriola lalandi dorsalis TaxID=1841481 RepID=A0A3B4XDZ1_SERLL
MYGPPVDLSFRSLAQISDALAAKPQNRHRSAKTNSEGKYVCCSMILNNNKLPNLVGFLDVLNHFVDQPLKLMWLDMSFNKLKTYLYLHVSNLVCTCCLFFFCRRYVISNLTQLKMMDFSAVTRDERVMAGIWRHSKIQSKGTKESSHD